MIKELDFKMKLNKINKIMNKVEDNQFDVIRLKFDFENSKLTINDKKTLRVENNSEYVYKFMKTKVKAIGGIEGLYNHIKDASDPENFWNNRMYTILLRQVI